MNKYRLVPAMEAPSSGSGGVPIDISPVQQQQQQQQMSRNKSSTPEDDWMDLVELFPPRLRQKVKLMFSYLRKGKIGRTEDNRIIYPEPTQEEGSSLYDLVYFFASPSPPNGHQARPPDALHFASLSMRTGQAKPILWRKFLQVLPLQ